MAAPAGNQFWKNRTKHGRDKLFSSPEILWETACEYFEWCEENPLYEIDYRGKDLEEVHLPKMRAFTWSGLELYLDIQSFRHYKTNPEYKDFLQVISQIENVMFTQKFEGAAAGFLNANIISRELGLADKVDQKTEHTGLISFGGIQIVRPDAEDSSDIQA